jgi:hypothetical protein
VANVRVTINRAGERGGMDRLGVGAATALCLWPTPSLTSPPFGRSPHGLFGSHRSTGPMVGCAAASQPRSQGEGDEGGTVGGLIAAA